MAHFCLFISYARRDEYDREISRRLRILLRRPLEDLARIFLDEDEIEPASLVDREIGVALDAAAAAVLLVSPDFINSDYVNNHELPAIFDRHDRGLCRVWPLNLRASVVRRHRYLDGRHLIPELDRPLRGLPIDEQESILAEIGDQIVTYLEELWQNAHVDEPDLVGPRPAQPQRPVVALQTDDDEERRGNLVGVPSLPDDYVARLDAVEEIWTDLQMNATAGIGGERSVGLHGQGGVGKSVLAAAVCRDDRAGAAFPGGILWLTVGERADPLAVQSALVAMLGQRPDFSNPLDGQAVLGRLLDDGDAPRLIVLDDVWSTEILDAVPPPSHGRRLITTRDVDGVLRPAGVSARTVELLDPTEAETLIARRLGVLDGGLPERTNELIEATGGNALLVAVVASALAMGSNPEQLLTRIRVDGQAPHHYLTVFRVLRAALDDLDPELKQKYLRLSVFPADVGVPITTITAWWTYLDRLNESRTYEALGQLHDRHLLTFDPAKGLARLHDHQHDFVSYECADSPRLLHGQLLKALNPNDDRWADLDSNTPYVWDYLVHHLDAAGLSVSDVVLDARYLARRIQARGPYAAIQDLERAVGREAADVAAALRRTSHFIGSLPDEKAIEQTVASWSGLPTDVETLRPPLHWPLSSGSLQVLPHRAAVNDVAFQPNGGLVGTASSDGAVRVWDPATGAVTQVLQGHTSPVRGVGWSPNGTRLATGSNDGTVLVWDPATGAAIHKLQGHANSVRGVTWSPDGTRLATASNDHTARIWDLATGATTHVLDGHTGSVRGVTWSPDGTRLATASNDHTARIWDLATGATTQVLQGHRSGVLAVRWSPDGTRLATASSDDTVRIWDLAEGEVSVLLEGHTGSVLGVQWSPDGTRLASASLDRTVRVWNPDTGAVSVVLEGHTDRVWSVGWSPDGTRLATASDDATVRVWDPVAGAVAQALGGHTSGVVGVGWSPEGTHLATASHDHTVRVWELATRAVTQVLHGHSGRVRGVCWSPDATHIATASHDHTVRIWDLATGAPTHVLTGHTGGVLGVAWSPDGTRIATASDDETVRVWDWTAEATTSVLEGHTHWVWAVAWAPDATRVATASNDHTVRVWDLATGATTHVLAGHTSSVRSAAWFPDGTRLATASNDRTVRIWDLDTGETTHVLKGHAGSVRGVTWSPDGTRLATASNDRTIRVWSNVDAGIQGSVVLGLGEDVSALAWHQRGLAIGFGLRVGVLELHEHR